MDTSYTSNDVSRFLCDINLLTRGLKIKSTWLAPLNALHAALSVYRDMAGNDPVAAMTVLCQKLCIINPAIFKAKTAPPAMKHCPAATEIMTSFLERLESMYTTTMHDISIQSSGTDRGALHSEWTRFTGKVASYKRTCKNK